MASKKFSTLRERMNPSSQARAAAHAEAMLIEMQLQELRKAWHKAMPAASSSTTCCH